MAEYIKRADAMTICERYSTHCFEASDSRGQDIADRILDDIAVMPTADVEEVKHGKWEWNRGCAYGEKQYFCSLCADGESDTGDDNYCPNCGAKMDGGKAE